MSAKVSIIVPAKDAQDYIDDCVNSIVAQTYADWELIIVDDASSEHARRSYDLQSAKAPGKISVIDGDGGGLSCARNIGIEAAKGDYLVFCDADDAYAPTAIEALMACFISEPRCSIAVCAFSQRLPLAQQSSAASYYPAVEALIATLYQRGMFHQSAWAKMYSRKLFDNVRFPEGLWYEDYYILPRLYCRADLIAFISAPLYYYRPNPSSFINTWSPSRQHVLTAAENVVRFVDKECPQASAAARSRRFSAYCNIFILAKKNHKHDLAKQCAKAIRQQATSILRDRHVRFKNKIAAMLALVLRP